MLSNVIVFFLELLFKFFFTNKNEINYKLTRLLNLDNSLGAKHGQKSFA